VHPARTPGSAPAQRRGPTAWRRPLRLPRAIEIVRTGRTERIDATFGGLFADDGWLGIVTP